MPRDLYKDLADCTEFRQTLQARPPRMIHGTVVLLGSLLTAAALWAAWTEANLVVSGTGRVRPMVAPERLSNDAGEETNVAAALSGQIVEIHVQDGDEIKKGDVLVQLDTELLDNAIAQLLQSIQTDETELAELCRLEELLTQQFQATKRKTEAELLQAIKDIKRAKKRRAADIRFAQLEVKKEVENAQRMLRLAKKNAVSEAELLEHTTRAAQAKVKLTATQLPIDESRPEILRRMMTLAERDYSIEFKQLRIKQRLKQGDVETARFELKKRNIERHDTVIRAPIDGIVTTVAVKVGDVIELGSSLLTLTEQRGFRIDVAVPSEDAGQLRLGMTARVKLDAYDYQKYGTVDGTVIFVSPDTQVLDQPGKQPAAFYMVKIELSSAEVVRGQYHGRIKLGMTGRTEIVTDRESILSLLVRGAKNTISLG